MVLVGLARVLCMLNYVPREKTRSVLETSKLDDAKLHQEFKRLRIKELKYNKFQIKELPSSMQCNCHVNGNSVGAPQPMTLDPSPDTSPLHLHQSLETDIREINRYIKTIIYKQKHEDNIEKIRGEWRAVALILDRLFFFLYVLSIVVSLATIFPRTA